MSLFANNNRFGGNYFQLNVSSHTSPLIVIFFCIVANYYSKPWHLFNIRKCLRCLNCLKLWNSIFYNILKSITPQEGQEQSGFKFQYSQSIPLTPDTSNLRHTKLTFPACPPLAWLVLVMTWTIRPQPFPWPPQRPHRYRLSCRKPVPGFHHACPHKFL